MLHPVVHDERVLGPRETQIVFPRLGSGTLRNTPFRDYVYKTSGHQRWTNQEHSHLRVANRLFLQPLPQNLELKERNIPSKVRCECGRGRCGTANTASTGRIAGIAAVAQFANTVSSGPGARIAAVAPFANMASSGSNARIAAVAPFANMAGDGPGAGIAAAALFANTASNGPGARIAAVRPFANTTSGGIHAGIVAVAPFANMASSGGRARIAECRGDYVILASSSLGPLGS